MGLFSFTQEIAMDLGTANTIITTNGKIVVDEPSVVALDRRTDKMIAVGDKAKMMHEKTHENIRTIRPLRDGVIADFYACEQMIRGLIKMVNNRNRLFSPSLRMVIGVPSGSTEVELRAVRDSAEHAGGRDVYLIFEPMAAAIGIGIDVEAPEGNMIVDIGGGSTEIAVISLGGIVANNSIRIAGDDFTADIQEYMSRQHNVKVSERMAARSDADQFLSEGFSGILHKPFSLAQLSFCLSGIWNEEATPREIEDEGERGEAPYDFAALTAFAEDDAKARRKILETFFQEINSQIEELKGAAARRDGIVVSRIAHKWQPIFAMLRISDMLPVLSRLEEEGAHKWTDELSRNLDKLLVCAEKIRTGLKLVLAKEE